MKRGRIGTTIMGWGRRLELVDVVVRSSLVMLIENWLHGVRMVFCIQRTEREEGVIPQAMIGYVYDTDRRTDVLS